MTALTVDYAKSAAARPLEPGEVLNFHAVAGARLERLFSMLRAPDVQFAQKLLLVVTEPGRALALHFMRCAEGGMRHGRPMICDFARANTSPIMTSGQYLSAFLLGAVPACRMVWQGYGHKSIEEWAKTCNEEVVLVRRMVLLSAASIQRRHCHLLKAPFSFSSIVDERTSSTEKLALAESFMQNRPCCVRPGLARDIGRKIFFPITQQSGLPVGPSV